MTSEQSKIDERCHICADDSIWYVSISFAGDVHVKIALCDNHRPKIVEIQHTECDGIISHQFNQQKMTDIHFGDRKETFKITGPEAPGLSIRRQL